MLEERILDCHLVESLANGPEQVRHEGSDLSFQQPGIGLEAGRGTIP
jgi:hypothetical protein